MFPGEVIIAVPGAGSVDATGYENIVITNAAPVVVIPGAAVSLTPVEGTNQVNAIVGTFTLPLPVSGIPAQGLPAGDFTASIDWGDSSSELPDTSAGTITQDANNPYLYYITGTHTYAASGAFAVANTVAFSGGTDSATINGVLVSLALPPARPGRGHDLHRQRQPGRLGCHRASARRRVGIAHRVRPDRDFRRRRVGSNRRLLGGGIDHQLRRAPPCKSSRRASRRRALASSP